MVEIRQKKIIIRADANTRMGTGHIMRCIAFGQAWLDAGRHQAEASAEAKRRLAGGHGSNEVANQKSEIGNWSIGNFGKGCDHSTSDLCPLTSVVFICAEIPDILAKRVMSEGFELIRIDAEKGSADDLLQTIAVLKSSMTQQLNSEATPTSQWLVTDGYHFNRNYQRGIRAAGIKLLLVDDYNHLPEYEADILLNQNIGAEEIEYQCNPGCRKLLGTRYVMLRREFREAKPRNRSGPLRNILVSMGGSDPDNASCKVIEALSQLSVPELHVKVIVGPANRHFESLRQAVSSATINCELINSAKDMPGLMAWADFAISAAGSTCWELLALQVPFVTVVLAENQVKVAEKLEQQVGVFSAGWVDEYFMSRLTEHLKASVLAAPAGGTAKCQSPVDCFGVDRILYKPAADSGIDIYADRLRLRTVSLDDARILFEWANDPLTRQNSFNPNPILWDSHTDWLRKMLTDGSARLFISELDGVACGHIRYQLEISGDALLSFVVSPGFRGMGIGDALVTRSRPVICKQWPSCRIKAITFQENRASSSIFKKNGFAEETGIFEGKRCRFFYWKCTNHEK